MRKAPSFTHLTFISAAALLLNGPIGAAPTPTATAATPPDTLVRLTQDQTTSFSTAINAIAQQGHVAIVAEGTPFQPTLDKNAAPSLAGGVTASTAISTIAPAYDYNVKQQHGVFVLTKRYTHSSDIPSLTLAECQKSAQNAIRVLETFNPHYPTSIHRDNYRDQINAFVQTLSPEQKQEMQDKALYYRTLTPDQQNMLQTFILFEYVQMPLMPVRDTFNSLQYAPKADLVYGDNKGHSGIFILLLNPDDPATLIYRQVSDEAAATLPPVYAQAQAMQAQTLGQIVATLKPIDGIAPAVESALARKLVTTAGLMNAAPMDVLRALETIYGLRIGVSNTGGNELEMRPALLPQNLEQIGEDLWAAMPRPLQRIMHLTLTGQPEETPASDTTSAGSMPQWQIMQNQMEQHDRQLALPRNVRLAAEAQLKMEVLPLLQKAGPKAKLPVASLPPAARDALAAALMCETFKELGFTYSPDQSNGLQYGWDHLDKMVVSGKPGINPYTHKPSGYSLSMNIHLKNVTNGVTSEEDIMMGSAGW